MKSDYALFVLFGKRLLVTLSQISLHMLDLIKFFCNVLLKNIVFELNELL